MVFMTACFSVERDFKVLFIDEVILNDSAFYYCF